MKRTLVYVMMGRNLPPEQQSVVDVLMSELPDIIDRRSLADLANTLSKDRDPRRAAAGRVCAGAVR